MAEEPRSEHGELLDMLLLRGGQGDHDAFRRLYDLQSPCLYVQALGLTRQPQLAADAVHDIFLQVWRRSSRFDPSRGRAANWLAMLLRNRAIDIMRRRGRESYGVEPDDQPDASPDALDQLVTSSEGSALRRCLDELEADQRNVILLAFNDGLSHSELAIRLQKPLGTVKSRLRRGLIGLRERLEAQAIEVSIQPHRESRQVAILLKSR